jgi:integrase
MNQISKGTNMKQEIQGLKLSGQNWTFSYRIAGKARRMKLGAAPLLVPADARKAAQHFAGLVAIGRCPASERKALRRREVAASAPIRDTIEKVAAAYLKHAKARTRESTFTETKRVFAVEILPAWRGRRLSEIGKQDVRKLVDGIAKRPAPVSANRALASIKTFLAFAVEQDILAVSPAASVRPPAAERARERTLSDDELAAVWRASLGLREYGAIIRLLILTGQRRSEVAEMVWPEIDLAGRVWNIPAARCKNGRAHSVPLSAQAIAILENFRAGASLNVFEPVSFSRMKAELDVLLPGMQPWVIHDLRRTAASGMAGLGTAPHVIEACLNHQSGVIRGVTATYNRFNYASEKRAALDLWGAHVAALEPLSKAA